MFPIINIGPLAIQSPGLILIIGLWVGLWISEKHLSHTEITSNTFNNLVFLALIVGIFGGRITYAIQHADAFILDPFSLVSLNINLYDLRGGLLFAFFAGLIYGGRKELDLWQTLDALTPLFGVLAITLGLSNLASGTNFGVVSNLPWALELWGVKRHPTQLYQIGISVLILFILWPGRSSVQKLKPGQYFLLFAAASAVCYIFIAKFTANINLLVRGIRLEQILAWLILALSLWGYNQRSN
jgi:phosphatidylglycerol:prolipoprotein diacylglycerol transferase